MPSNKEVRQRDILKVRVVVPFVEEGDPLETGNMSEREIGLARGKETGDTAPTRNPQALIAAQTGNDRRACFFPGVSSVAATKHANRLEQKELVRRKVDEWDRRRVFVNLTSAGWSMLNEP